MKRIIVSIVIFIIIVSFCFISRYSVNKSISEIIPLINSTKSAILQKDFKRAEDLIEETDNIWHNKANVLSLFMRHNEIDEIDAAFIRAKGFAKSYNYDFFIVELDLIKETILHLSNMDKLTLGNIF